MREKLLTTPSLPSPSSSPSPPSLCTKFDSNLVSMYPLPRGVAKTRWVSSCHANRKECDASDVVAPLVLDLSHDRLK